MPSTTKDLTAGTAGGIAQVLVGQPFDIVKVRMQTAPTGTYKGMVHCATGILKNEGPLAFYKGTLTPLLGVGACVSIQFGALEASKRFFATRNKAMGEGGPDGKMLSIPQLMVAGSTAGLANSVISGPVEHIRIRMQTQSATNPTYRGPFHAIGQIYTQHGIRGIYKGQASTLVREAFGYAVYFAVYESLLQYEMKRKGVSRKEVSPMAAIVCGATAGLVLWPAIYPIDVIKSRMQTDAFTVAEGRRYKSTMDCVRQVWHKEGPMALTRGLGPAIIRSPFANAATFVAFELANRALNNT